MNDFHTVTISKTVRYQGYDAKGILKPWAWCIENLGPGGVLGPYKWNWDTFYTFVFRDEEDAVMFSLRWS